MNVIHSRRREPMADIGREVEQELQGLAKSDDSQATRMHDLGRMTAEAVMTQYESAAKAVEEMGQSVKDRVHKLEAAMIECDKDMKLIEEAAKAIREKGNLVQVQIEEVSSLSSDIRAACEEFKKKVGV